LVDEVINTYSQVAMTKSVLLVKRMDARLGKAHWVDSLRLSQILNNFVCNALKFTAVGKVEVSVLSLRHDESSEKIRFIVQDTGIGIAPEVQQRLFQNYGQASADTARMYGGTGLGLAICGRLADLMDGQIALESTLGQGASFSLTLTLPLAESDKVVPFPPPRDEEVHVTPLIDDMADADIPRILVADDHPINRNLLSRQLAQLGLRSDTAENGAIALTMWQTGEFAVLMSDCHMPEMDGYALARQIRALEAQTTGAHIPIIAWTANVLEEEKLRCFNAGMDAVLTKPTNLDQLRDILSRWLAVKNIPKMTSSGKFMAMVDFDVLSNIAPNRAEQSEILLEFQTQNELDIHALHAALQAQDTNALRHAAHRIKGAARMVGAIALEKVCTKIEQAAQHKALPEAIAAARALDYVVEQLNLAIERFNKPR
jgi:CheY-like chemotaxis protein